MYFPFSPKSHIIWTFLRMPLHLPSHPMHPLHPCAFALLAPLTPYALAFLCSHTPWILCTPFHPHTPCSLVPHKCPFTPFILLPFHPDEVYVDKELLLLIHYLFWVCTCEGSHSNQILWETKELLLPAGRRRLHRIKFLSLGSVDNYSVPDWMK